MATNHAAVTGASHARGATAKLNRRHAQASRPQVNSRPVQAKAAGGSHRDSQPKEK